MPERQIDKPYFSRRHSILVFELTLSEVWDWFPAFPGLFLIFTMGWNAELFPQPFSLPRAFCRVIFGSFISYGLYYIHGIFFFQPAQLIFPEGVSKSPPLHEYCTDYIKEMLFRDAHSPLQFPDSCKTFLLRGSSMRIALNRPINIHCFLPRTQRSQLFHQVHFPIPLGKELIRIVPLSLVFIKRLSI